MSSDGIPVLWQIAFSHYNEKARWALDYKGVRHRRRNLAPGSHVLRAKRLWGGSTTPVIEIDGRAIGESSAIIEELERLHPDPRLYPSDDEERARALQTYFDTELGPYIRGAVFDAMLQRREALLAVATQGLGARSRVAQQLLYPINKRLFRRVLVDGPGGPAACREKTVAALERLEAELDGSEHLVGDGFSVADLTAASLFSPLVAPPEAPFELHIERWPEDWQEFRAALAERPGYRWVGETYRRHRGSSAEVSG